MKGKYELRRARYRLEHLEAENAELKERKEAMDQLCRIYGAYISLLLHQCGGEAAFSKEEICGALDASNVMVTVTETGYELKEAGD